MAKVQARRRAPPKSFRAYIRSRSPEDSPAGDFIADAKADRDMPDPKTWAELNSYLSRHSAVQGAVDAARVVWRRYQAAQRRGGRKNA